jgi:hypothetical protein
MAISKTKILPIDDLTEVKEIGEKQFAAAKKKNAKKQKEERDSTTVTREKIEENADETVKESTDSSKEKEFPEFELSFDPFADQSAK